MPDGVVVAPFVSRVHGLHACIESQGEEVEGEAEAQTVTHGNLAVEFVEAEFAFGLVFILADGPDVACIDEESAVDFPEQMAAQFDVEVEFDVTALVEKVDLSVGTLVGSRTEAAH